MPCAPGRIDDAIGKAIINIDDYNDVVHITLSNGDFISIYNDKDSGLEVTYYDVFEEK